MPATKVNLSQMVDLALGSPEVGSVNFNVLHTLLHAMLKRLNIVDVTADISDFDRDFLSASKARELSVLSDIDSGRGSEVGVDDTLSERSSSLATPSTGRKAPYHHLEIKVAKLQEQLDNITSVPSNKHLFDKTKTQYEEKPIGEMWLNMQLMSRVETNEKGIAKCMSMIEDMMREMQTLKDANKNLMDKVKGLNIDDLMKRLKDLESKMNDMNDKFNLLPSPDDFAQFVTWTGLEDALSGIKKDWENLQQPDRVVIEMSSQTEAKSSSRVGSANSESARNRDQNKLKYGSEQRNITHSSDHSSLQNYSDCTPSRSDQVNVSLHSDQSREPHKNDQSKVSLHGNQSKGSVYDDRTKAPFYGDQVKPSRPTSSRPGTRMSSGSTGPSETLLEILEKLGSLSSSHDALTKRVEDLEAEIKNKLDKGALDNLNISSDLLEQLQQLKQEVDALAAAREKLGVGSIASAMSAVVKASSMFRERRSSLAPLSESEESSEELELKEASSEELLLIQHEKEMQAIAMDSLRRKVGTLEDRFKLFQDMVVGDSAYQSNVSDLKSWLTEMENRPDPLADLMSESDSESAKSSDKEEEKEVEKKKSKTSAKKKKSSSKVETKPEKEDKKEEKEGKETTEGEQEGIETPKKTPTKFEQEIIDIFTQEKTEEMIRGGGESPVPVGDLVVCNNKVRTLAYVLNDQLHAVRDQIFTLEHDLKKMAKGVEFALLRAKVAGLNEMDLESVFFQSPPVLRRLSEVNFVLDHYSNRNSRTNNLEDSDALSRAQAAIAQLQAEVEKLHGTTKDILEENNNRAKEIEKLFAYCDKLQEVKADKEYVQAEVDVKADKRLLDNKVNHTLFDTTTNDIHKMIKEILEKLSGNEDAWNHRCKVMSDDIEGKLDRLELDPLKEWLESRLKALNDKLRKTNQAPVEWNEDDAAGIRRQLIQKFHCISCDRPVDIVPTGPVPSLPSHNGLHPTRSPRPYTTFELDQIRQHAKRMYAGIDRPGSRSPVGRNNINFERALAEKQLARMRKSDLKAFLVHFKQDIEVLQQQKDAFVYANAEISDYYATNRSCGGQHTTTFPQKRITKLSHLSHLFREEEPTTNIYPIYKEEVDVQGADGNIYKGRMERLEAKLPSVNQDRIPMHRRDKSPQPVRQQFTRVVRPASAKQIHSPRPPSGKSNSGGSPRPQSAHPSASQQEVPGAESSHTTPAPSQSPVPQEIISVDQAQQQSIEIPAES